MWEMAKVFHKMAEICGKCLRDLVNGKNILEMA